MVQQPGGQTNKDATKQNHQTSNAGHHFNKRQESYQQPMYNDELHEVVQQNCDFFSQQEQTYNSIYSPAMSSSPAPIEQQQQLPLVIITSPVDCCSRTTTKMKRLESRLNSMENEV